MATIENILTGMHAIAPAHLEVASARTQDLRSAFFGTWGAEDSRLFEHACSNTYKLVWLLLLGIVSQLSCTALAQLSPPPLGGAAPPTHMVAFGFSTTECPTIMDAALRADGLAADGVTPVSIVAQNKNVAVAITCFQQGSNPLRRIMIVAASTDDSTALWYCNDLATRIKQLALHAPATGLGAAPTSGSVVTLTFKLFNVRQGYNNVSANARYSFTAEKFNLSLVNENELLGSNKQAFVAVSINVGVPTGGEDVTNCAIIAVSTDAVVAQYYRDDFPRYVSRVPL